MRGLFAILAALTFTECGDAVTERFTNLDQAKSLRAFDRGWLPPVLPNSAKNIVDRHDLDANTGRGEFHFEPAERTAYLEQMARCGALLRREQNSEVLTLTSNGSRWEIRLPHSAPGQATWSLRQP